MLIWKYCIIPFYLIPFSKSLFHINNCHFHLDSLPRLLTELSSSPCFFLIRSLLACSSPMQNTIACSTTGLNLHTNRWRDVVSTKYISLSSVRHSSCAARMFSRHMSSKIASNHCFHKHCGQDKHQIVCKLACTVALCSTLPSVCSCLWCSKPCQCSSKVFLCHIFCFSVDALIFLA